MKFNIYTVRMLELMMTLVWSPFVCSNEKGNKKQKETSLNGLNLIWNETVKSLNRAGSLGTKVILGVRR